MQHEGEVKAWVGKGVLARNEVNRPPALNRNPIRVNCMKRIKMLIRLTH